MRDSNYGPEDPYSYDEPAVPYIPYSEQQNTQALNAPAAPRLPEPHGMPPTSGAASSDEAYTSTERLPLVPAGEYLPPMPMPSTEAIPTVPALPRRRSRRAMWLTRVSVLVLLVIVAGSAFALVSYLNRSTPMKTLDTFCTALQKGDYGSAYNQFTKQLQGQFTENDFASLIEQNKVVSCTHGKADDTGARVTTSLKLLHADKGVNNDLVMLTKGADSIWLINDLQRVS